MIQIQLTTNFLIKFLVKNHRTIIIIAWVTPQFHIHCLLQLLFSAAATVRLSPPLECLIMKFSSPIKQFVISRRVTS